MGLNILIHGSSECIFKMVVDGIDESNAQFGNINPGSTSR
jgi:hypothetical protein